MPFAILILAVLETHLCEWESAHSKFNDLFVVCAQSISVLNLSIIKTDNKKASFSLSLTWMVRDTIMITENQANEWVKYSNNYF